MKYQDKSMTPNDLEDLINWLATKPPMISYNYNTPRMCPLAQYLTDRGFKDVMIWETHFATSISRGSLPEGANRIVAEYPRSYEGALARARAEHANLVYGISNNAADA